MILVCGIPRSGTTWIAKILSHPSGIHYFHEPDNEHNNLLGYIYKQKIPRFPYLTADDPPNGIHKIYEHVKQGNYLFGFDKKSLLIKKLLNIRYSSVEKAIKRKNQSISSLRNSSFDICPSRKIKKFVAKQLYQLALPLKKEIPRDDKILVKSVHSVLALSYINHHFNPKIVVVLRHPANIVSSHLKLSNPDIWRNIFRQRSLTEEYFPRFERKVKNLEHPLEKAGAQISAFYFVLADQLKSNADLITLKHENFCRFPFKKFKSLFAKLGIQWTDGVRNKISELNKSGKKYSYKRIAAKQIGKWKRRLNKSQIEYIKRGYSIFPQVFYTDFIQK